MAMSRASRFEFFVEIGQGTLDVLWMKDTPQQQTREARRSGRGACHGYFDRSGASLKPRIMRDMVMADCCSAREPAGVSLQ